MAMSVQAEGLSFLVDFGWVATGKDVIQVVDKLEACSAESIEWASRRYLLFDTAKTEAPLSKRSTCYKKPLRPKLTPKTNVGNGFVRFNKEATDGWESGWMPT